MRRRECGIVRDGAGRQLPLAAARSRLGPAAQRFRKRGVSGRSPPDGAVAARRALRSPRRGGPSCGLPGRQAGVHGRTEGSAALLRLRAGEKVETSGFPSRLKRWVKNCHPTGVAAEQASNTARGTPSFRRSRVTLATTVLASRGVRTRGSNVDRRSARPPFLEGPAR
jgi:hypothetical protein